MKFLITGSKGFIGSWLLRFSNGVGIDRERCDIRKFDCLDKVVSNIKPSHIIHLAAISNPQKCEEEPELAWDVNVIGTENILRLGRKYNAKVVVMSSALIYLENNVYVKTKRECEKLAEEYGAVVVRPFNQEGPGRQLEYFTSKVILAGLKEEIFELWNPKFIREFMDVRDGARGLIKIALEGEGIYDLCTGVGYSKEEYLRLVEGVLGKRIKYICRGGGGKLVGDPSRLKSLGWKQRYTILQTIKDQVNYIKTNYNINS